METLRLQKKIKLGNGCFEEVEASVYFVRLSAYMEFTVEDAMEHYEMVKLLSKKHKTKIALIVDISRTKMIGEKQREILSGQEVANFCKGLTLITSSYASMLLGNLFIGINKPIFPTRICNGMEEALHWIRQLD